MSTELIPLLPGVDLRTVPGVVLSAWRSRLVTEEKAREDMREHAYRMEEYIKNVTFFSALRCALLRTKHAYNVVMPGLFDCDAIVCREDRCKLRRRWGETSWFYKVFGHKPDGIIDDLCIQVAVEHLEADAEEAYQSFGVLPIVVVLNLFNKPRACTDSFEPMITLIGRVFHPQDVSKVNDGRTVKLERDGD
jgi:hypothetical protein